VARWDPEAPAPAAASRLAERLRSLRQGVGLTQESLAGALGGGRPLGGSTISSWETAASGRIPPPARLTAYARLFCTRRSFAGGRAQLLDDLGDEELEAFRKLESELLGLRAAALAGDDLSTLGAVEASRVWRFTDPDRMPVTLVVADVEHPPAHADPSDRNYVRAASFADLDALLDLFGHIRAENPQTAVRIRAERELKPVEMVGHLVVIGGVALNEVTDMFAEVIQLPVEQDTARDDIFVVKAGKKEFGPTFVDGTLVEDVGLFARAPNPQSPGHSLTICSGVTTRGVRGAVQCFTDPDRTLRERNEAYIAQRFSESSHFGLLMRVKVFLNGESLAPDLTLDETRLYEWWDGEEAEPASAPPHRS
jgi:transcriptional regulator with XRE-family HTH domain